MKCHYLSSNVHRLLATELEICGRLHEKYITPDFNEFVVDLKETLLHEIAITSAFKFKE